MLLARDAFIPEDPPSPCPPPPLTPPPPQQALLRTLIFRYTMQDDIIVGVRMPCRGGIEISQSVGPFENTLPLVCLGLAS